MASRMSPVAAFGLGFGVGFAVAFLSIGVLGLPFFFLASAMGAADLFLLVLVGVSALAGLVFGTVSLALYYLWSALTRTQQFVLVVALLAIGLLFVQVELDAVALIGLAFTMSGVGKSKQKALVAK
ncbi:MAG: hypothetical protein JRM80_11535 [Nitrososphaerota archaeon]|jgi:hypothetical protein|nr:hypothetical protein [Nitrososphaerota archaeon]MDG7029519.1 hypothetical protein [Nitrososphaerota archaeon]